MDTLQVFLHDLLDQELESLTNVASTIRALSEVGYVALVIANFFRKLHVDVSEYITMCMRSRNVDEHKVVGDIFWL